MIFDKIYALSSNRNYVHFYLSENHLQDVLSISTSVNGQSIPKIGTDFIQNRNSLKISFVMYRIKTEMTLIVILTKNDNHLWL